MDATAPLPFVDVAHGLPYGVAVAFWVALDVGRAARLRSRSGSRRDDRGSAAVVVAGMPLAMTLAVAAAFAAPRGALPAPGLCEIAGIALMVAGIVLRSWAIRVLGPFFTYDVATRPEQTVCTAGPYRVLRHPSYAGTLLTVAGATLALGNVLAVAAGLAAAAAVYAYRIAVEERVLRRDLGAPYVAYAARTWRLVPFVY